LLSDLHLTEAQHDALAAAGFTSVESLQRLDVDALPDAIPLSVAKQLLHRVAELRPRVALPPPPPPPPPAEAGDHAVMRSLSHRDDPDDLRLIALRLAPPPLPPSPSNARRDVAAAAHDDAAVVVGSDDPPPPPPPTALKSGMLKKLHAAMAVPAVPPARSASPPPTLQAQLSLSGKLTKPTGAAPLPPQRTPSPPTPDGPSPLESALSLSPRRHHHHHHHHHHHRSKKPKEKPAKADHKTHESASASTSPSLVEASDAESHDELKAAIKVSKSAKLTKIFGERPAAGLIDAEVAAIAQRAPLDRSTEMAPGQQLRASSASPDVEAATEDRLRLLKERKKAKLEKLFGMRPASILLNNDAKAKLDRDLPALLRESGGVEPADSDDISARFDADADEARRSNCQITVQLQVPTLALQRTIEFPSTFTVADALAQIRQRIPVLSEEEAFVLCRVVDATDVPLRTTQSIRVFSKVETNSARLVPMGAPERRATLPDALVRHQADRSQSAPAEDSHRRRVVDLLGLSSRKAAADAVSAPRVPRLMEILVDAELCARFELFLKQRHADESLRCWKDIADYKLLHEDTQRHAMANAICDKYFKRGANDEVNVPDAVRRMVNARRRIAACDLFEDAEDALLEMMRERFFEFLRTT
jgi:hypothetical protein